LELIDRQVQRARYQAFFAPAQLNNNQVITAAHQIVQHRPRDRDVVHGRSSSLDPTPDNNCARKDAVQDQGDFHKKILHYSNRGTCFLAALVFRLSQKLPRVPDSWSLPGSRDIADPLSFRAQFW
jgi:hypothetical protein